MKRGMRQGVASSGLLFYYFHGWLVYLADKCASDEILGNIHTLIHADDAVILSTNRDKFGDKYETIM